MGRSLQCLTSGTTTTGENGEVLHRLTSPRQADSMCRAFSPNQEQTPLLPHEPAEPLADCQTRLFYGSTAAGGDAVKCAHNKHHRQGEERRRTSTSHPLKREGAKENVTEKRDDEEHSFFKLLEGRRWKLHHKRQTPKNNDLPALTMQPVGPQQQYLVSHLCVFSPQARTIELLLHHSDKLLLLLLLLQGALLGATIMKTPQGQQIKVTVNTLSPYYDSRARSVNHS